MPGQARYRIDLDTTTDTSWSFSSAATSQNARPSCARDYQQTTSQVLPLIFLGYNLPLGLLNQAPGGSPFSFTVDTTRPQDYQGPAVASLKVQVSFDDGASWQNMLVGPDDQGDFTATVRDPKSQDANGYAALRVTATDTAGNKVSQTIMRAYALAPSSPAQ